MRVNQGEKTTTCEHGKFAILFLMAGVLALLAPMAQAGNTSVWINAAGGYWTNGANWNTGIAPADGDTALLTNTLSGAYTVTLDTSISSPGLQSITISNNATLIVTQATVWVVAPVTLTNAFTLAGSGTLEVDNGGYLGMTNQTSTSAFNWTGTNNSTIVLNNGGTLRIAGASTANTFASLFQVKGMRHRIVSTTPAPGGTFDNGKLLMDFAKNSSLQTLALNNVTLTNVASLSVGSADTPSCYTNALLITNGSVVTANSLSVGFTKGNQNSALVDNSRIVLTTAGTFIGASYSGTTYGGAPVSGTNDYMVVTNGGSVIIGTAVVANNGVFGAGSYLVIGGTNAQGRTSVLDLGAATSRGLFGIGGSGGTGDWVRVDAGGILTNWNYKSCIGAGGAANYNSLIITNGGKVYGDPNISVGGSSFSIGGYVAGTNGAGNGNSMIVSGSGSLFDLAGTTTNYAAAAGIYLPFAFGTNGSLVINNNGVVKMKAHNAAVLECGNQLNALANAVGNVVSISSGGTLETLAMTATNLNGGNYITNNGGIYQFAGTNILLKSSGGGAGIYLVNGTIAYRGITNACVLCNQSGQPLDAANNMTFAGNNAFRLNAATNRTDASQTYTFDPGLGAANFSRLEMVNGATRYRGMAGDALTIATDGQMLCSNTTAQVDLMFANNGTLTIENSTLTLATNAVLNGKLAVDMNNLSAAALATGVVHASGDLTLGGSSTLQLAGAGTNVTVLVYSGHLSGTFATISLPPGYGINYGTGLNSSISVGNSFGTFMLFK